MNPPDPGQHDPKQEGSAFEYVAGTLSPEERADYERMLDTSAEERARVAFWQEQLLELDLRTPAREPRPSSWNAIANHIQARKAGRAGPSPFAWLGWLSSALAGLLLLAVFFGPLKNTTPNTDYIAVLTDNEGQAVLTALTTASDSRMWLKWEAQQDDAAEEDDSALQLWAISKRDGQVRSLAVFEKGQQLSEMPLNEANFRLVSDSSFLLLTREEAGGSAIDEPSDELIARGVCVRFGGDS